MPFGASASWRRLSSVQRELPPSMIVSPSSSSSASSSTVCWVGSPAGTMIQTERVELGDELLERGRAGGAVALGLLHGVLAEVEHHAFVVGVPVDAVNHVPAHLPEADESELHQMSLLTASAGSPSSRTWTAGSPWSRSVCRSPTAWAFFRWPNVYPASGISTSSSPSCTSCTKRPVGGPPLCICPVEWRKRGP